MYQLVIGDVLEAHSVCMCERVCASEFETGTVRVCVCVCVSVYVTVCDLTLFITLWLIKY